MKYNYRFHRGMYPILASSFYTFAIYLSWCPSCVRPCSYKGRFTVLQSLHVNFVSGSIRLLILALDAVLAASVT